MGANSSDLATKSFSKELLGSGSASHGNIRENFVHSDLSKFPPTLYHNFIQGVGISGDAQIYGTRNLSTGEYEWLSYNEALRYSIDISSSLVHLFGVQRQENVGIFAKNRTEWCLVEHGCNRMSYCLVPLYDTLGPKVIPFIVNQTSMRVIFCGEDQLTNLLSVLDECPSIQCIVHFGSKRGENLEKAHNNVQILSFDDFIARGREQGTVPADPPTAEDIATICYTSGTTGSPKGAMLSHGNLMAGVVGISRVAELSIDDIHISYLPLPHIFERVIQGVCLINGGSIGFYQGDILLLMDDIAKLRPTIFVSVPRLLNRVYDKITQGVEAAGGLKKLMFNYAYSSKEGGLESGDLTHALWDKLVFSKIRMLLGGRIRIICSGSAPLSKNVKDFLQIAFCCPVFEGYGLTETCACATAGCPEVPIGNDVGIPLTVGQVRLVDVKEMNYTSQDKPIPRGEICLRGPQIFKGYYKAPDKTAEVIDDDGWFHTGDIGCWNQNGTLKIIDRKKNIFKLAQGEYVAPEKLENVFGKSKFVAQSFVHGDSLQPYLVAIVVPDPEIVLAWADENNLQNGDDMKAMCALPKLKADIFEDMKRIGREAKLQGFEFPKQIYLESEIFSVDNNLVTPTFKLKRPNLKKHYASQIDAMYASLK